jgi:dihydroorotate dehydrogenase
MRTRNVGIGCGPVQNFNHIADGLALFVHHITFGPFSLQPHVGGLRSDYASFKTPRTRRVTSVHATRYTNNGLAAFLQNELIHCFRELDFLDCKIRISLVPFEPDDLRKMFHLLEPDGGINRYIDTVEIDLSAPNFFQNNIQSIAHSPEAVRGLLCSIQHRKSRVAIKLPPLMVRELLESVVRTAADFGIEEIVSGGGVPGANTTASGTQLLSVPQGTLGGEQLLNDAVAQVRSLEEIIRSMGGQATNIAIVGCGGVMTGEHAKAMLNAGASQVQVVTLYMNESITGVRRLIADLS